MNQDDVQTPTRATVPLSAEELDRFQEPHVPVPPMQGLSVCQSDGGTWPCRAVRLVAMARRVLELEAALKTARDYLYGSWAGTGMEVLSTVEAALIPTQEDPNDQS